MPLVYCSIAGNCGALISTTNEPVTVETVHFVDTCQREDFFHKVQFSLYIYIIHNYMYHIRSLKHI